MVNKEEEIITVDENSMKLRNQRMLLGVNGLAYTAIWQDICKKIKRLEEGVKK